MKNLRASIAVLFACVLNVSASAKEKQKVTQFVFQFAGKTRTVYAFIPEKEGLLPLILLLPGPGRDGEIMASLWKDQAGRDPAGWDSTKDTPEFFAAIVDQVKSRHGVDPSRIYLTGHSAGASYALFLSVIDSTVFAATAVHASALEANPVGLFEQAERKMPIAIWVGDRYLNFPWTRSGNPTTIRLEWLQG